MNLRKVFLTLGAIAAVPTTIAGGVVISLVATGKHKRMGASLNESAIGLPGDDLLPAAPIQNDRAITIPVPPDEVWPWIAQIGQNKAGFYSFEMLENAMGCEIRGADTIHPEWQNVTPGDLVTLAPGMGLRIADAVAHQHLVLTSEGGEVPAGAEDDMNFDFTWAFVLSDTVDESGSPATRLHIRERYRPLDRDTGEMLSAVSVGSAIMTWAMMRNIKKLATGSRVPAGV